MTRSVKEVDVSKYDMALRQALESVRSSIAYIKVSISTTRCTITKQKY